MSSFVLCPSFMTNVYSHRESVVWIHMVGTIIQKFSPVLSPFLPDGCKQICETLSCNDSALQEMCRGCLTKCNYVYIAVALFPLSNTPNSLWVNTFSIDHQARYSSPLKILLLEENFDFFFLSICLRNLGSLMKWLLVLLTWPVVAITDCLFIP